MGMVAVESGRTYGVREAGLAVRVCTIEWCANVIVGGLRGRMCGIF